MTLPATLTALFIAFALTILAPDNAAAQTPPPTLNFGTITLSNGVEVKLNLIAPVATTDDTVYTFMHVAGPPGRKVVTVTGGKTYYFLDADGGGTAVKGQINQGGDSFAVADIKLLFADSGTDIRDTHDGDHDGVLDERSYTIGGGSTGGGYTLVLPTVSEWEVLRASHGVPKGWLGGSNIYASSSPGRPDGGVTDNYNYQPGFTSAPGTFAYRDDLGNTLLLVAVQVIPPENLFFRIKVFLEGAQ